MTTSPRPKKAPGRTTKSPMSLSAPMLIFVTALDTTWRIFLPILGGVFLGIGIDHLLNIAPIATIVLLIVGIAVSMILITKQLTAVRRPR